MKKMKPQPQQEGLVGFFGHTYTAALDNPDETEIQYQFEIIRKIDGDRYAVQYFSYMDGSPTSLGIYSEADLLGPTVKLYANADLWNAASSKDCERQHDRRRATRAAAS
jgi:hypothetical protein